VEKSIRNLSQEVEKEIERWGLTRAGSWAILSGVRGSIDVSHAAEVDPVTEATPDDLELETSLFLEGEISAIVKRVHLR